MKKVYLDNAATTAMRPEVIAEITAVMETEYGNPSSGHSFGRSAKSVIELARKNIALLLKASAPEIIFTSGGTESNNWLIRSAVHDFGIKRIISSPVEHHAVLETVEDIHKKLPIEIAFVKISGDGSVDLDDLERLLADEMPTLVSLMHVNNETGAILDLEKAGNICRQYKAYFHTDAVQSVGKMTIDLSELPVDFLSASAHKFHGPKGIGFAYIRKGLSLLPLITGGEQEKGSRAGTESTHNIAGMSKALSIAFENLAADHEHINGLNSYLKLELENHFPGYKINCGRDRINTIANIMLPIDEEKAPLILFQLDIHGIAVSRGSACQSGSPKPSHVLAAVLSADDLRKPSLRISFSHENTKEDIDRLISALKTI